MLKLVIGFGVLMTLCVACEPHPEEQGDIRTPTIAPYPGPTRELAPVPPELVETMTALASGFETMEAPEIFATQSMKVSLPTATPTPSPSPFVLSAYQTAIYVRGTPTLPSTLEAARATYVAEVFTRTPAPTWEPKPTSTLYTSEDVMNNIVSCCHWVDFAWDPDVVVSATFGAELERTTDTLGRGTLAEDPIPVPTSYWEIRYMELNVTEVFKGGPRVRAGDRLVVADSHPDNELRMIVDYASAPLAQPVSGTLNLFFLNESDRVSPHGPVYAYNYPQERLVVTAEGVWIATPERHRMLSVMDMPGAVFLKQLRGEITLAEAMKQVVRRH